MTAPGQPPPPGAYTVTPGAANHLSVMASYTEQSVKETIGGGYIDHARLNRDQFRADLEQQNQGQLDDVAQGQSTAGNTLWRSITPLSGWTGTVHILRIGPAVEVAADLYGASSTDPAIQLPSGFTPHDLGLWVGAGTTMHEVVSTNGSLAPSTNQSRLLWRLTFLTTDQWPATEPGFPA